MKNRYQDLVGKRVQIPENCAPWLNEFPLDNNSLPTLDKILGSLKEYNKEYKIIVPSMAIMGIFIPNRIYVCVSKDGTILSID